MITLFRASFSSPFPFSLYSFDFVSKGFSVNLFEIIFGGRDDGFPFSFLAFCSLGLLLSLVSFKVLYIHVCPSSTPVDIFLSLGDVDYCIL